MIGLGTTEMNTKHTVKICMNNYGNMKCMELMKRVKKHMQKRPNRASISRREADKVVVPPWPQSHDLDGWKSQLMANVLSACADPDPETWISWIGESFKLNPDITRMKDSGGLRFTTINVKLANALNAMIASSGDNGKEVGMEIKVMVLDLARRDPPQVVEGRQIVAMILESFRSSTHTDLMFTGKHLYELNYPGDSKLNLFRNQWIHLLSAMREDDKPKGLALRDILFDKIKGSSSMAFDIRYYRNLTEGDPSKSYEYLMGMMARTVSLEREERNRLDKAKGINQIMGSKALAVENTTKKDDKPKPVPKAKSEAAPVVAKLTQKDTMNKKRGKVSTGKEKIKEKGKTRVEEDHLVRIVNQSPVYITFRKVDVQRVKIVHSVTPREGHPEVPVLDLGMAREETRRMIEHHLRNRRARNLAFYMRRGNVIAQIVLTSMILRQLLPKVDQQKQKQRLPKGRPKLQLPKPKVRR